MGVSSPSTDIDGILQGGEALKLVNLSKARKFNAQSTEITEKEFFQLSGLELLLKTIFEALGDGNEKSGKNKIGSLFFEYSTLGSALENNILSSFLCLWQQEAFLNTDTLANQVEDIISILVKEKLSLYYFPRFFIKPKEAKANITSLPTFMEGDEFSKYKSEYDTILTQYNANNNKGTAVKTLKAVGKNRFVQHLELKKVTYKGIIDESERFKDTDILPYHLLLHSLYDKNLLLKPSAKPTILLSIPLLGAPVREKDCFNGQGAFFLYLIPREEIARESLNFLARQVAFLNKELTYNYLFEIGLKYAENAKKSAIKSAIIQYMARNLSHNTGSHLIPEAIVYFQGSLDRQKSEEFTYYQKYTQERMELLAQMSSMKSNHNWTNYNLDEIVREFNASIIPRGLCDDLNNKQKTIKITLKPGLENRYVSLPDGAVGKQALFVIFENFIRNAYKHSKGINYLFEINITNPAGKTNKSDYWCIDLYDKLGKFNQKKRSREKLNDINNLISSSVLTDDSKLRDRGWGILEMKSASAFLTDFQLEKLDDFGLNEFSTRYYDLKEKRKTITKNLGHRFYLFKPRLLIIDEDIVTIEQKQQQQQLRSKGILISKIEYELVRKLPHQFLITNKPWNFTNHKLLADNIDTSKPLREIENLLWERFIEKERWKKLKIISSPTEQETDIDKEAAYFDFHGDNLKFKNETLQFTTLKDSTEKRIKNLGFYFYHPYKTRSGVGRIINAKNESCFRGILVEAVEKKVLIIDERIQNAIKLQDNDQPHLSLNSIFTFMGIDVPLKKEINLSEYLETESISIKKKIKKLIDSKVYHYVILHLTILEKLAADQKKDILADYITNDLKEEENFIKLNRALILVSGRGEPPNLPINCYYLNYTTLYDSLVYLGSKPHLIQALSSIRKR